MTPIIAVLGEDTVKLESDFIYEFMGRGYMYTYQTVGEGQATVEVSNDLKNWITLFDVEGTDSIVLMHPWKYQRVVDADSLEVHVLQGRY